MYKPYEGSGYINSPRPESIATQERHVIADESLVYIPGKSNEDIVTQRRERTLQYLKGQKSPAEWRAEGRWYAKNGKALMLGVAVLFLLGGGGSNPFSEQGIKLADFINGTGLLGGFLGFVLGVGSLKARAARRAFNAANQRAFREDRPLKDDIY